MKVICSECGCPYEDNVQSCPECGCPTPKSSSTLTNCPNCGAPTNGLLKCEYCDTVFPREVSKVTYINGNKSTQSSNAADVGTAAFLGGLIGGLLD